MGCLMKLNDPQHRGMMMIISSIYTGGNGGGKGNEVQRNKGIRGEMALTAQIKLMMLFTMKMVPHK